MVCTYIRAISKVSIKGEVNKSILKEAIRLLDGYMGQTESDNTDWLGVNLKDGSLNSVKITIVKGGLEVQDFYGVSQEKVAKQITMLYQAKAQEAILRRMGYQTKVEKAKDKIRIRAVR